MAIHLSVSFPSHRTDNVGRAICTRPLRTLPRGLRFPYVRKNRKYKAYIPRCGCCTAVLWDLMWTGSCGRVQRFNRQDTERMYSRRFTQIHKCTRHSQRKKACLTNVESENYQKEFYTGKEIANSAHHHISSSGSARDGIYSHVKYMPSSIEPCWATDANAGW